VLGLDLRLGLGLRLRLGVRLRLGSVGRRGGAGRPLAVLAAARAATQLASIQSTQGRPADALVTLEPALAFFKDHKFRRLELTALSIATRAYQDLDDIPKARELASEALKEAEITRNDYELSLALNNFAAQATVLGSLPEALALRDRAEAIHRRQADNAQQLPYDLTNRADLLIRLGRFQDADAAMAEVEEGALRRWDVYVGRLPRLAFLRALTATVSNQLDKAAVLVKKIPPSPPGSSAAIFAPALDLYVRARLRPAERSPDMPMGPADPASARERQYWIAATALARGDNRTAHTVASSAVDNAAKATNDELKWRLAAIGSIAARRSGDAEQGRALRAVATAALDHLRSSWGPAASAYEQRPDLDSLRKAMEGRD